MEINKTQKINKEEGNMRHSSTQHLLLATCIYNISVTSHTTTKNRVKITLQLLTVNLNNRIVTKTSKVIPT